MSTRVKVFLIITAIVLAITVSSMIISIFSAQEQILGTLEKNMEMLASSANEYIMNEMDALKKDTAEFSNSISMWISSEPWQEQSGILTTLISGDEGNNKYYKAIAWYNSASILVNRDNIGDNPAQYLLPLDDPYIKEEIQKALNGENVITTTINLNKERELVFFIIVPYNDASSPGFVSLTVSGMFFSDKMKPLVKMNPSGRISILDEEGTIIADAHDEWVMKRMPFIQRSNEPSVSDEIQDWISSGKSYIGRYALLEKDEPVYNGQYISNVTAFMPIASQEKWVVAVSTPIINNNQYVGSSYFTIRTMIGLSGLIFVALGALAAALASGVIARPFELLKAATKAKTAFIANMSHDLRTPLNAIVSLSQLSRTFKALPPEVGGHQKKIFESGMNILGVINDLLDISNIESGKFGVISAEYDLPGFITDTANSNLRHIGSRPIVFNIVPAAGLFARLNGDSLRIRQIFNNLLRNAICSTKAGTVEWLVSTEKSNDTVWLVSSVLDSGPGLNQEDIDKLFLDYSSLDNQKMRSSHGTGLGLALTKKIVDLMKGTITVESTVGKGTTFTVKLPHKFISDEVISDEVVEKLRAFKTSAQKYTDIANIERIQLPDAKVLVVDDMELNLDVTRGMLEPYGMQVDGVLGGKEAAELIRKAEPRYDAIFMNRWMPEMDGIEAVRIIRNEIGTDYAKNVPIIALVVNAITGNNAFFMKSGFQAVLSKPISVLRLDDIVQQWVAKK